MRVAVVAPPAGAVLSLDEVKLHLRVDGDEEDTLIEGIALAVVQHLAAPDGWLGRSLGPQVIEMRGDFFAEGVVRLPFGPVIAVEAVEYESRSGPVVVLAPDQYELRGDVVGSPWGTSWPAVRAYRGSAETVRIRYRAGYEVLPAPIRSALLLMAEDLYRNRGTTAASTSAVVPMSTTVTNLLSPYRLWS